MNTYELVKNYNILKNKIKKRIIDEYNLEDYEAEFYKFDIVLDEQDRVVVKFTIQFHEPTMFKSYNIVFDEFSKKN